MESLFDLNFEELAELTTRLNQPKFRTLQIWKGLYNHDWVEHDDFSNLPVTLRDKIFNEYTVYNISPSLEVTSKDGLATKTLFNLQDGRKIETVLMHYKNRNTLCISSQSGCAMECTFCATGRMGFFRNLTSGEIIQQVIFYACKLKSIDEQLTNVVFMGMGEPFHNYEETLKAIKVLNHPEGFDFGARRFTISTVGIIPGIKKFTEENFQANLAISLHAATNEEREKLIPISRKYSLDDLMKACVEYVGKTHRRITFEWALINSINDRVEDARQLLDLLTPLRKSKIAGCHVNIIPLNPTRNFNGTSSNQASVNRFQEVLVNNGIPCSIRLRRGIDIDAGCGQLAAKFI